MGSDSRIQTKQPFTNVDIDEWEPGKDFMFAYRPNYKGEETSGITVSSDGLGRKKDITETTTDMYGKNLVNERMPPSLTLSEAAQYGHPELAVWDYTQLSYLMIPYYDFNGNVKTGEMVVDKRVADEVLLIFQELYNIKYPIKEMVLVDNYGADDWVSIQHNNTSSFNNRWSNNGVSDEKGTPSNHRFGLAIDINPLVNPYITNYWIEGEQLYTTHNPNAGDIGTDRSINYNDKFLFRDTMPGWTDVEKKAKCDEGTEVCRIFEKYGWAWNKYCGGKDINGDGKLDDIDIQHFDKKDANSVKTINWDEINKKDEEKKKTETTTKKKTTSSRAVSTTKTASTKKEESTPFTKYNLTEKQLKGLTAVAFSEQGGTLKGAAVEASLMANLFELKGGSWQGLTGGDGLYKMVSTPISEGGWFDRVEQYIDTGRRYYYEGGGLGPEVTEEQIAVVKKVLVDGIRVIPGYIDEHDSWNYKDFRAYTDKTKKKEITNNREEYVPYQTYIENNYGSKYTFWNWADPSNPNSDEFGYTSEENRQRIGEFYYDFDSEAGVGEINSNNNQSENSGANSNSKYYIKYATWNQTVTDITYNDPSKNPERSVQNNISTQKLSYQDYLSGYTMPFNYLWALLVMTGDKDFVMEVADLVYNSEIEITVFDNYTVASNETFEKYKVNISKEKEPKVKEYTKTTKTTTTTYNTKVDLTRANVWIVDYVNEYEYKKITNGAEWKQKEDSNKIKEKTDIDSNEPNFVTILNKYASKRYNDIFEPNDGWIWKTLENPDNGLTDMIDLTKYLWQVYKNGSADNVDEKDRFDFSIYDPKNFKKMSSNTFVGSNLEEKIWFMLKDIGYTDEMAAGAMGNFSAETDSGTTINNKCVEQKTDALSNPGEGHGIAQWSWGRKENLLKYADSVGKSWEDIDVQLEFLKAELTGGGLNGLAADEKKDYPVAYQKFANASTPEEAAVEFNNFFERCSTGIESHDRNEVRKQGARHYYDMLKGKEAPTSTAGGGNQAIVEKAIEIHKYMEANKYEYCSNNSAFYHLCSHSQWGHGCSSFEQSKSGLKNVNCVQFVNWVLSACNYPTIAAENNRNVVPGFIEITDRASLQPGDILIYTKGNGFAHTEIYAGDGQVYNAGDQGYIQQPTPRASAAFQGSNGRVLQAGYRAPNQ